MTKTQYFQLKHLLKTISNVIKASKCDLKHIEKTYSTLSKDESLSKNFPQTQRFVTDSIFHDLCFSRKNIIWYKRDYRLQHIVFSIARGKTYSQIEQKVHKSNRIHFEELKQFFIKWDVKIPAGLAAEITDSALVTN